MKPSTLFGMGCVLMVIGIWASGCSSKSNEQESEVEEEDIPTLSTCPPTSQLSYQNFGRGFMESYCVRCHSSSVIGSARQQAPVDHNFDSLAGILEEAQHIDMSTASGPGGTNTSMPPSGPAPSIEERRKLGEWLACEAARAKGGASSDAGTK